MVGEIAIPIAPVTWTNLYPGVDHATGINPAGGTQTNVNLLRVDLSQSQIVLTATSTHGLCQNGVPTTQFLQNHFAPGMLAMFAINANYFDMADRSIAYGLVVSQGNVVFPFDPNHPYEILISKDNAATIVDAGAGATQDCGPCTAVSGGP